MELSGGKHTLPALAVARGSPRPTKSSTTNFSSSLFAFAIKFHILCRVSCVFVSARARARLGIYYVTHISIGRVDGGSAGSFSRVEIYSIKSQNNNQQHPSSKVCRVAWTWRRQNRAHEAYEVMARHSPGTPSAEAEQMNEQHTS